MNTKNFLLAIIILASPFIVSAGIDQKNNFKMQHEMGGHHTGKVPVEHNPSHWETIWLYDDNHHRCEKTGRLHRFHFERFYRNRRKKTTFFFVKALLLIIHLSSFLLSVVKVLH